MSFSRRNGTVPSCEPCRKAKVRCDHEKPCRRCTRRGETDECLYHPAPLSRPPRDRKRTNSVPLVEQRSLPDEPLAWSPRRAHTAQQSPAQHADGPQPLGRENGEAASPPLNSAANNAYIDDIAAAIVHLHNNWALIDRVYRAFCTNSIKCLVPGDFSIAFLDSMSQLFRTYGIEHSKKSKVGARTAAKQVLDSTAVPGAAVDSSSTTETFIASCSANNLSAQTLGYVCNHAARAALVDDERSHEVFVEAMLVCSTKCLSIARDVAPRVDDTLVWLGHDNLYLLMAVKGDRDPIVWPRLGLLGSDLYSLGLQREATLTANAPTFLVEMRRRVFASVYHLDYAVCTYFRLPPRVLRKYADTKPPLDLSDRDLLGNDSEFTMATSRLTADGWSSDVSYSAATWARMRYFLGVAKEELPQFSYCPQPLSAENRDKLRALSDLNHLIWNSFPAHVRFNVDMWQSGLNPAHVDMLIVTYLSYLNTDLGIYRLLDENDPSVNPPLLSTAAEMLAVVIQLGNVRDRPVPLAYVVWNWGIPSVAVLTPALAARQPLPNGLSKAKIVRHLSVFASYLENMFQPGNANYKIAKQVSSSIVRTLDDILDEGGDKTYQISPPFGTTTPASSHASATPLDMTLGAPFPRLDPALGGSEGGGDGPEWPYDEADFVDLMMNIDWASVTNNEWSFV
ncbi:Hypothetical protein R9X50_00275400 [Acrodontium crateriforme]|uniref:Zn(2)-C6 fungal-type domain-containing protein n=1 Tax=Acrodontium crateriforme TaxID=150365 RepID=A0AAQ3M2Q4_9PEZI|nr:Hypothetical protein R9X50_00275400 [Acrodontium crateriforme]